MSSEEIIACAEPIFRSYGIRKASLIGSQARNEARKESDIDFIIDYPQDFSLMDLAGLILDLEDILDKKIDIMSYNQLDDLTRPYILEEEQAIYG